MQIPARFRDLTPNLHARASLGRKIPLRWEPMTREQKGNAAKWIVAAIICTTVVLIVLRAWFG